jgi:hypothetical protein
MADKPHGSRGVVHEVWHLERRRASMDDSKDRVSVRQERRDASFETRLQCLLAARLSATAHNPDDSKSIWLGRSEDFHRQRHAKLAAVDHIGLSRVFSRSSLSSGRIAGRTDHAESQCYEQSRCALWLHTFCKYRKHPHAVKSAPTRFWLRPCVGPRRGASAIRRSGSNWRKCGSPLLGCGTPGTVT